MSNECRMYRQKFPKVDELVMVNVRSIAEMGAYVSLLEYNNIEGMILMSELSRRRIRSINKLIRVGRQEVVMVLRVDEEKGYIDLSKRRVSPEEVEKCEAKYAQSKAVHSVLRHVAEITHNDLNDLYERFGWDMYDRYGHAIEGFKASLKDPEVFARYNLEPDLLEALMANIKRRMSPQPIKIRAEVELTCFSYAGIDGIKAAIRDGEASGTEETPIKIKLVAPPLYVIITTAHVPTEGIEVVTNAIETCKKTLEEEGGQLIVKNEARVVNERDDKKLNALMSDLARENQEKAGDAPEDDDE
eukprot:TRINITY_DN1267_c0_g2_i1.p1 TRINITY_DN1267_c0_g2~~TRINITY_DN1267_c0_g2_i1.p1  ORF type:complete len:302 (-),score=99.60 TRINITY_DN1267_c0_g2_i1:473-1378(-)